MFELMDSKGNRFLLSRHRSASNYNTSGFSRLLIKHLLRDCDSLSLQKAYRALLGIHDSQTAPNYWHATLSPQGTISSATLASTSISNSSLSNTTSLGIATLNTTEEKLFAAIANGSIKIQQTHKAAKGSNSQAQKGFALSSTKLRNTLHALTQQSTNNPQQHWQLQSQSSGPESERLKQFYKRFLVQNQSSSSSPSNNEASGISAQQREILLALGFVPHKISSERYAQTQNRCHQLWRTTELVKLLDGFVSRYGTSNLNVELGGPGHIDPCARLEIAQRLLLAAEAEPNALQSPINIPSLGTFKKAGKALQDAIDISQSLSKEKQETGSAMNLSDLASDDSDVPANNAPPTALTFIEITLLDHEGEPVANEPYWIRDPEGNEYTGNTDGSGMARVDSIKPGMCQVSFPERDGGAVQQCGATVAEPQDSYSSRNEENCEGGSTGTEDDAASEAADTTEEPKCSTSKLEIQCSHSKDRKYTLNVITGPSELNGKKGMQVISHPSKPEEITAALEGNCINGKECPEIELYRGSSLMETHKAGTHKFKLPPKKRDYSQESFLEFYRKFLLPNIDTAFEYETYQLKSKGCEATQKHEATIHAFPNFKWAGKVGLGYADISKKPESNAEEGWFVNGEIGLELGSNEWKYTAKQDFTIDSLFPSLQGSLGDLFDKIRDITKKPKRSRDITFALGGQDTIDKGLVDFKFTPPNISLGGEVELKEVEGKNNVDMEGKLSLGLSPLVKADLSTDIFDWLIILASSAATGGAGAQFGKFLVRVKGWAAKRGAVVQAIFNIEGAVEAKLEWTKKAGDTWKAIGSSSEAQASLTMGLKAEVSIEKTIWKMSAKAGAELYVKGAKSHKEGVGLIAKLQSTEVDGKPGIDGTLTFTGLGIYYAYYAEFGIKDESTTNPDSSTVQTGGWGAAAQQHSASRKTEKIEKLWTVLEAKTWFKDGEPKAINEAPL